MAENIDNAALGGGTRDTDGGDAECAVLPQLRAFESALLTTQTYFVIDKPMDAFATFVAAPSTPDLPASHQAPVASSDDTISVNDDTISVSGDTIPVKEDTISQGDPSTPSPVYRRGILRSSSTPASGRSVIWADPLTEYKEFDNDNEGPPLKKRLIVLTASSPSARVAGLSDPFWSSPPTDTQGSSTAPPATAASAAKDNNNKKRKVFHIIKTPPCSPRGRAYLSGRQGGHRSSVARGSRAAEKPRFPFNSPGFWSGMSEAVKAYSRFPGANATTPTPAGPASARSDLARDDVKREGEEELTDADCEYESYDENECDYETKSQGKRPEPEPKEETESESESESETESESESESGSEDNNDDDDIDETGGIPPISEATMAYLTTAGPETAALQAYVDASMARMSAAEKAEARAKRRADRKALRKLEAATGHSLTYPRHPNRRRANRMRLSIRLYDWNLPYYWDLDNIPDDLRKRVGRAVDAVFAFGRKHPRAVMDKLVDIIDYWKLPSSPAAPPTDPVLTDHPSALKLPSIKLPMPSTTTTTGGGSGSSSSRGASDARTADHAARMADIETILLRDTEHRDLGRESLRLLLSLMPRESLFVASEEMLKLAGFGPQADVPGDGEGDDTPDDAALFEGLDALVHHIPSSPADSVV